MRSGRKTRRASCQATIRKHSASRSRISRRFTVALSLQFTTNTPTSSQSSSLLSALVLFYPSFSLWLQRLSCVNTLLKSWPWLLRTSSHQCMTIKSHCLRWGFSVLLQYFTRSPQAGRSPISKFSLAQLCQSKTSTYIPTQGTILANSCTSWLQQRSGFSLYLSQSLISSSPG